MIMKTKKETNGTISLKCRMLQTLKLDIWAVNCLYLNNFTRFARINKKTKKIIFNWQGRILFSIWPSPKERLAVAILTKWYRYTCWEEQLCFFKPQKPQIDHTWGEIQDIIRMTGRYRPIKPYRLSD